MKHLLLILISLLLLSSPVIGQETGVLYLYESSSGFVLKSFGDGKVQPKYKGEITNGKPDGFGVMTYPYGEKSVVGEWKNGKEWNTKHTKKDGTLIGKFENGEWIVSWGVFYLGYRNGNVGYFPEKWEGIENEDNKDFFKYEGEVEISLGIVFPNGQGTEIFPDGIKYVGEFKYGKRNGQNRAAPPAMPAPAGGRRFPHRTPAGVLHNEPPDRKYCRRSGGYRGLHSRLNLARPKTARKNLGLHSLSLASCYAFAVGGDTILSDLAGRKVKVNCL